MIELLPSWVRGRLGKERRKLSTISASMNEMVVLVLPSNEAKVSATAGPHSCLTVNSSPLVNEQGVQANPLAQYPSFLKQLLKSHLSGKFYLGLPKKFCDAHLPSHDETIVLVDENEQEYRTKYSVRKNRLGGGWRGFSMAHKLLEGDALVFHLIEHCKFRVYIVRAGQITENDGAMDLQTYDLPNAMPLRTVKMEDQMEENALIGQKSSRVHHNSLEVDNHQETKRARIMSNNKLSIDVLASNVLESVRYSGFAHDFKDMKSFEDFKILIDGKLLNSQIPMDVRIKYYNLCCSQKMFLHDHLIKGLSIKLVAVMISETVDIADAIRLTNLATSLHHLECWEKTLKAFEDLGMTVGFLRHRIHELSSLSLESQATVESRRTKIAQADEEISHLEATSLNVKAIVGNLEHEVEALNLKNGKLGFEFQALAGAPW